MKTLWIPSALVKSVVEIEHSPFQSLQRSTRSELNESRAVTAAERRLGLPNFVETFDWESIRALLPLQLPTPGEVSGWSGRMCRSSYQWLKTENSFEILRLDAVAGRLPARARTGWVRGLAGRFGRRRILDRRGRRSIRDGFPGLRDGWPRGRCRRPRWGRRGGRGQPNRECQGRPAVPNREVLTGRRRRRVFRRRVLGRRGQGILRNRSLRHRIFRHGLLRRGPHGLQGAGCGRGQGRIQKVGGAGRRDKGKAGNFHRTKQLSI